MEVHSLNGTSINVSVDHGRHTGKSFKIMDSTVFAPANQSETCGE